MKRQMASEMCRVLKPDGLILWYDYHMNNPWNAGVRGVKKREIHRLFPGCSIDLRRITLAPPFARWIVPRSWLLAYLLERLPHSVPITSASFVNREICKTSHLSFILPSGNALGG